MKELKNIYFSHDTNASHDPKLIRIRMLFGWKGIGMYWGIIEALHKEKTGELPDDLISSLIYDYYSQEEIRTKNHIIEEADDYEKALYATALLVSNNGMTTSRRVLENIEEINSKSESARQSALKRWSKSKQNINKNEDNANAMRTQCERNAINKNKINKNKINKNKINIIERENTPSSVANKFFNDVEEQERVIEQLTLKGYEPNTVKQEIAKFLSYWTEPNKSGSKQRWEIEQTFEIGRRLATWFSRIKTFNNFNQVNKSNIVKI